MNLSVKTHVVPCGAAFHDHTELRHCERLQEALRKHTDQTAPASAVRPLGPRDVQPLAALLADVFADNPAYQQIFEPRHAPAGLRWLFAKSLLLNQRSGTVSVLCAPEAPDQIIGTFSLIPPDAEEPSIIDYIRLGVLGMPFRFGVPSTRRMFSLMKENQQKIAEAMKGGVWWYLGMVAVAKSHRNRGIASLALAQAFAELSASARIALSTQRESNVRLYSRLGFEVRAENYLGCGEKTVRNWVMCRSGGSAR